MSPTVPLSDEPHVLGVEVEKKESDEEPMEMVVEKHDEVDTKNVNQILTEIVKAKMTEDLKPMDTDKEILTESKSPEMSIQEDSGSDIAPMQTDDQLNKDMFLPGPNEKPLFTAEPLTLVDLTLLAELFYLPYEHGPKAVQMLKEFNWLRVNSNYVSVNSKEKDPEKVRIVMFKKRFWLIWSITDSFVSIFSHQTKQKLSTSMVMENLFKLCLSRPEHSWKFI